MALAECGTHAIFAAMVGTYAESEADLGRQAHCPTRWTSEMLLTADRGFFSYACGARRRRPARICCGGSRTDRCGLKPTHLRGPARRLVAGRCVRLHPAAARREEPLLVRVIDYTLEDGARRNSRGPSPTGCSRRCWTPRRQPRSSWPGPTRSDGRSRAPSTSSRPTNADPGWCCAPRHPDLVLQEIWGHLCCHYAIRTLMVDAAEHAGHDPDRVTFVAALRISRRSIAQQGAFPPSEHP